MGQPYDYYQLFGRNLLAIKRDGEVYSFNIEDCAPMPTQMPSLSMAPTTCYGIDMRYVYGRGPRKISWYLERISTDGDFVVVGSYEKHDTQAASYAESMCLLEGEYKFSIQLSTCGRCGLHLYHNITTSNGVLIGEAEDIRHEEVTRVTTFSLPFVPAPSAVPAISQSPSSSLSPSIGM